MRIATFIAFLFCATARANPLPVAFPAEVLVYMSSERLTASISPDEAELKGTFTFSNQLAVAQAASIILEIPIWFPEIDPKDSSVADFWKSFRKDELTSVTPQIKVALEKSVGLHVSLGGEPLAAYRLTALTSTNSRQRWAPREWQQETGFCCLVFEFYFDHAAALTQKPLTISYRQPLLQVKGAGEFFYLPVLQNLPKSLSTTDTNRYTITIIAEPRCSLVVSNGGQKTLVEAGHSITLSPRHHQAIRAIATTQPRTTLEPRPGRP
jgi:hypothetical protein